VWWEMQGLVAGMRRISVREWDLGSAPFCHTKYPVSFCTAHHTPRIGNSHKGYTFTRRHAQPCPTNHLLPYSPPSPFPAAGDFWNKHNPQVEEGYCNPGNVGFDEWHSTEAQTSISVPNCGCFPPPEWTPPNPQPVFPTPPPCEFPHTAPGANCIVGGGIYVNESFDCANYWFPSSEDNDRDDSNHLPVNLTEKLAGDDGDYIVDVFDDFVGRAGTAGRPFLSALWMHYIHLPHPAMPTYYSAAVPSRDPDYIGALAQMDYTIGRLREILKKHGVFNNTLVWFTSDNVSLDRGHQTWP